MNIRVFAVALALLPLASRGREAVPTLVQTPAARTFTSEFRVDKAELKAFGRNRYFVLEPGYQLVLDGGDEHLVITVLPEAMIIDGVQTRIVEERETKKGNLVEVSRNYFAISARDSSVYYFGEDVDMYANGRVTSHEGSWRSGVNGARFGLIMPSQPAVGRRYYQELAPKVAMDRAEIVSIAESVITLAGSYVECIRTEETTPLEPEAKEYKRYCPGVGLVEDAGLRLVGVGRARR